jgi:flagellar hook-associated protein 2
MVTAVTSTSSSGTASATAATTAKKAAANITNTLGAGSGIDTNSLASNLVAAERAPREAAINKNITKNEGIVSGMSAVKYAMSSVKAAFDDLKDTSDYNNLTVSNSDTSAFTAVATSLGTAGNHSVEVTRLALPQRTLSSIPASITATDDTISTSAITLTLTGGSDSTGITDDAITVDSTASTPAGVVAAINEAGLGITAYLMYNGSTYNIMVTGPEGADNTFTLTSSAPTELYFGTLVQSPVDAALTVDDVEITSSSNTVTDAIGGVTLYLMETSSSAATLSLQNDTTAVKTKLQNLVTVYNDAMSLLDEVANPASTLETYGATLVGNSTVRSIRDTLRGFMTSVSTTPSTDGSYNYLVDIGVSMDRYGKLSIDKTTLDTVLSSDYSDVIYVMTGDQDSLSVYDTTTDAGIAGEASRTLYTMLSSSGSVTVESANATTRIAKYQADLTALEERMQRLLERYTKQFSSMDSIVGGTKSTQTGLKSSFDGLMAMYTNN